MTSQQSTERIARTNAPRRTTARRGLKKRGILPSFGDIVLPVVSIAAVALLVLAGRQFFINGMKTSPGITSTRAYADSPAIIAEREKKASASPTASKIESAATSKSTSNSTSKPEVKVKTEVKPEDKAVTVLAVAENNVAPPIAEVKPAVVQPAKPKPAPAKPVQPKKPAPAKQPAQSKAVAASSNLPMSKQWRVQTGAYTTKTGAEDAAKKIRKAGYTATVYHNPASKHVKVWVAGGATKAQAEKVVAAMKKMGYKSSFAFPPSK